MPGAIGSHFVSLTTVTRPCLAVLRRLEIDLPRLMSVPCTNVGNLIMLCSGKHTATKTAHSTCAYDTFI